MYIQTVELEHGIAVMFEAVREVEESWIDGGGPIVSFQDVKLHGDTVQLFGVYVSISSLDKKVVDSIYDEAVGYICDMKWEKM